MELAQLVSLEPRAKVLTREKNLKPNPVKLGESEKHEEANSNLNKPKPQAESIQKFSLAQKLLQNSLEFSPQLIPLPQNPGLLP